VKAGFDIDLFSEKDPAEAHPSPEYKRVYEALQTLKDEIARDMRDSCFVEVVPFNSTVYVDPKKNFQSKTLLRVRVGHGRGLEQPASTPEERALKKLQEMLLATEIGPLRQFNLAHPRLMVSGQVFS
jgi:hypothetical protein